jgi:hypothetical protein
MSRIASHLWGVGFPIFIKWDFVGQLPLCFLTHVRVAFPVGDMFGHVRRQPEHIDKLPESNGLWNMSPTPPDVVLAGVHEIHERGVITLTAGMPSRDVPDDCGINVATGKCGKDRIPVTVSGPSQ